MQCPYCLSEVAEEAFVCKVCTRDLYLFKPMMAKVAELGKQLEDIPNHAAYEHRISELESLLDEQVKKHAEPRGLSKSFVDIAIYLLVPLVLILVAHSLITIVYDAKIIYLRIISMILPLPFGYFLFKTYQRNLFPWFMGVVFLAIASVIGMSWMTSLIDHTPIWPQSTFEWREVLEYSASIAPLLTALALGLGEGRVSPSTLYGAMKKLHEYGGMAIALGTTAVSIYTGLKGFIGN